MSAEVDHLAHVLADIRDAADEKLAAEVALERGIRRAAEMRAPKGAIAKAAGISRAGVYRLLAG